MMTAATLVAPGAIELREVSKPVPGPDEVLVRLQGCGVCVSNVPVWEGRPWFNYPLAPGQLGHEGWGVVEQVGAQVDAFKVGDRVGFLSDHAYAEYDLTAPGKAVRLPPALSEVDFPAEPLGCAMNIARRVGEVRGKTVAIVGIGFLGAVLTELLVKAGARVIAVARKPLAQAIAGNRGGEVVAMDDHWRIIEDIKSRTKGALSDIVVECTGKQWPLDLSAELCGEYARLVIAGYHQDGPRQVNMQAWNWKCLEVINAHERDPAIYLRGMREAAYAVASGLVRIDDLITHRFPLDRLAEALEATRLRPDGFFKAVIKY